MKRYKRDSVACLDRTEEFLTKKIQCHVGINAIITEADRKELAGFIGQSVLPGANKIYDRHWKL